MDWVAIWTESDQIDTILIDQEKKSLKNQKCHNTSLKNQNMSLKNQNMNLKCQNMSPKCQNMNLNNQNTNRNQNLNHINQDTQNIPIEITTPTDTSQDRRSLSISQLFKFPKNHNIQLFKNLWSLKSPKLMSQRSPKVLILDLAIYLAKLEKDIQMNIEQMAEETMDIAMDWEMEAIDEKIW